MGTAMALPGAMANGNARTPGTTNSGDDEAISLTMSGHCPALLRVTGMSVKESRHTFPKLPVSAMMVTSRGAGALPERSMTPGLAGSSLVMVILADFEPTLAGWKRIGTSIDT